MTIKKTFVFLALTIGLASTAFSQEEKDCISAKDLKEISEKFSQFERFLSPAKTSYCKEDIDHDWLVTAKAINVLKNIKPNEPLSKEDDALSLRAINEKDWWNYFTSRASKIRIHKSCQEYVVAYVVPFYASATVNLCPIFIQQSPSDQASTLMHEVRHFDGFRHTKCTQGYEEGFDGACDFEITDKGSYAISVQVLVGLARAEHTDPYEKEMLQAQALYMAYNKFNTVPKVRVKNDIILSDQHGHVYKWNEASGEASLITKLDQPARVLNSANQLTVYPLDASEEAYRMDKTMKLTAEHAGTYADFYNAHGAQERQDFDSISYLGLGGILRNNAIIAMCDPQNPSAINLDSLGDFKSIISLSMDKYDFQRQSFLVDKDGSLLAYGCAGMGRSDLDFKDLGLKMSKEISDVINSFTLNRRQYALLGDGTFLQLGLEEDGTFVGGSIPDFPLDQGVWVSATPLSVPEVFN